MSMSNPNDDALYNIEFENNIREFNRLTNTNVGIASLSPIIEALKESKILEYLMKDPTHSSALTCLRSFIQQKPYLPQEFVGRFLSVASVRINVLPNHIGVSNQSYVAKVITNNVKPPTAVTNFTINSMKEQLRNDITKTTMHVAASTSIVPTELKIKLDQSIMNTLINSIGDLCKTIQEGNRMQGRESDSYIRNHIKH